MQIMSLKSKGIIKEVELTNKLGWWLGRFYLSSFMLSWGVYIFFYVVRMILVESWIKGLYKSRRLEGKDKPTFWPV